MQVFLDGVNLTPTEPTLAGAIDVARAHANQLGRLIVDVSIDGNPITEEMLESPESAPACSEVRFTSTDPVDLIETALADGVQALEAVKDVQAAAQEALQSGDSDRAKVSLQESFQTWMAIQALATKGVEMLGINTKEFVASGVHGEIPFDDAVHKLLTVLREVSDAVQKGDAAALADLVGYDLQALAGIWISILESLAARARGMRGGHG